MFDHANAVLPNTRGFFKKYLEDLILNKNV